MPISGAEIQRLVLRAGRIALKRVGEDIHDEAQRQIGNVDPSEDPTPQLVLRQSGRVSATGRYTGAGSIRVQVSFGRMGGGWHGLGTAGYAIIQHERMDLAHPRGGKPKWLGDPLKAKVPTLAPQVAAEIRKLIG